MANRLAKAIQYFDRASLQLITAIDLAKYNQYPIGVAFDYEVIYSPLFEFFREVKSIFPLTWWACSFNRLILPQVKNWWEGLML